MLLELVFPSWMYQLSMGTKSTGHNFGRNSLSPHMTKQTYLMRRRLSIAIECPSHTQGRELKIPVACFCTDRTVVLGSLRRFKTFMGNPVSSIINQLPPERWRCVHSPKNPTDCAWRGMYPTQLMKHELWWDGLQLESSMLPEQPRYKQKKQCRQSIIPFDHFANFNLKMSHWMNYAVYPEHSS